MSPWIIIVGVCITGLHTPTLSMVFWTRPGIYILSRHNALIVNAHPCGLLQTLIPSSNLDPLLLWSLRTTGNTSHWQGTCSHYFVHKMHSASGTFLQQLRHYYAPAVRFCFSLNSNHPFCYKFHTTSSDSRLYSSYRESRMASCFSMAGRYMPRSLCMPLVKPLFTSSPSLDTKAAVKLW